MGLGKHIHTLWRLRAGVLASALLAAFAALWSVQEISLAPPGLTPRALDMATAATHVVVDTPTSAMLDLRQDTYSLESLTNRAVLLGNVMASDPVRSRIAARAGVPAGVLATEAPLTPEQPRPRVDTGQDKTTADILKSMNQYRLSIRSNPTVPVLDIYAQTPTAASAERLANAAVDELRLYLARLATTEDTPEKDRIQLVQLGRAEGAVINDGVRWQAAVLAFLLTFGVACATVLFIANVREGWRLTAGAERAAA